jgi:Ca2+/Na+ antiporter
MSLPEASSAAAVQAVDVPAGQKTWFSRVDKAAHKIQGMQTINIVLLAWVIVSGGVAFNLSLDKQSNVYHQMHAVPFNGARELPPPHYLSMDWIMTAKRVMSGATVVFVGSAVSKELCQDDAKDCNPLWWQTYQGCNASTATQLRLPPLVAKEQVYFYGSTRATYRHLQPRFTCLAEKISDVAVYQNNENSYSIGSTHNANVLAAAVFMICAVVWSTMFIATWRREAKAEEIHKEYMKRVLLTALVAIYIITTYIYASDKSTDINKDQHRPIGIASYAYSTVFLLFSLLVFNQSGTLRDNTSEFDRMKNKSENSDESQIVTAQIIFQNGDQNEEREDDKGGGYPLKPLAPAPDVVLNAGTAMRVRRFVNEPMHTDTRIKLPYIALNTPLPPPPSALSSVSLAVCALISTPVHSKFVYGQLLTLPLALLALRTHGNNFGLDTYTQAVFVCTGVFCLIDVFLYRMWWAFQIHKGVTFFQADDVGEYRAMEVLTLLSLLLQVAIFVFFLVSDLFAEEYMWFFVVYIIFTSLAKIFGVMAIRQHKQVFVYGGPHKDVPSTNFDYLTGTLQKSDFYMFVVYTILISILLWVHVIQEQRKLDAPWAESMPLVRRWGPGWQQYNVLSM